MKQKNQVREPIATWWKIEWKRSDKIMPLRVVAFTERFVTYIDKMWSFSEAEIYRECRESREDIFPTFAEAKAAHESRTEGRIDSLKEELQRERSLLGQIQSLKEPQP